LCTRPKCTGEAAASPRSPLCASARTAVPRPPLRGHPSDAPVALRRATAPLYYLWNGTRPRQGLA